MNNEVYQIMSLAARYWFIFLLVVIVLRCFIWLKRDTNAWKRYVQSVPSAGIVGEAVVLIGNDALPAGTKLEVPREGLIGSGRISDIILPSPLIAKRQIYFRLDELKGLYIETLSNAIIELNAFPVTRRSNNAYIVNASILKVEDIYLKFYFFVGFGVPTLDPAEAEAIEANVLQTYYGAMAYAGAMLGSTQSNYTPVFPPPSEPETVAHPQELIEGIPYKSSFEQWGNTYGNEPE